MIELGAIVFMMILRLDFGDIISGLVKTVALVSTCPHFI